MLREEANKSRDRRLNLKEDEDFGSKIACYLKDRIIENSVEHCVQVTASPTNYYMGKEVLRSHMSIHIVAQMKRPQESGKVGLWLRSKPFLPRT